MKQNIVRNFASIGASLIFTLGQVHAGVVTSSLDDGNLGSLRKVIANAASGETITFAPSLDGKTITLTNGQLVLTKNVQIVGPGANLLKISGNNASRAFYVNTGVTATISGLTIANGLTPIPTSGGGTGGLVLTNTGTNTLTGATVVNGGTLVINSGTIPTGSASTTVNAVLTTGAGGLVKVGSGTLTLTGTNTPPGTATVSGGTLVLNPGTTIPSGSATATLNAVLTTNAGATLTVGSGALTLTGANTYTGSTTVNGGTLVVNGGVTTATGSGTLAVGNSTPLATNGATLTLNGAGTTLGGTLATTGNGGGTISGGTLVVNSGTGTLGGATATTLLGNGGANNSYTGVISSTGGTLTVGGVSATSGGSIVIAGPPVNVAPPLLILLPPLDSSPYSGGAILNKGGTVTVTDCVLTANVALAGGAIGNFQGNLTVIKSSFLGNQAIGSPVIGIVAYTGAAIYTSGGTASVSDSLVSANVAILLQGGSAITNFEGHLTVSNSTISDNQANGIGSSGDTSFFSQNPSTLEVVKTTISGNVGCGIVNGDGDCKVTDSSVSENSGGGISNTSAGDVSFGPAVTTCTLTNCTIARNSSGGAFGGGITSLGNCALTVRNCTIAGNTANTNGIGGIGIFISLGTTRLTLSNTILAKHSANLLPGFSIVSLGYNLSDDASTVYLLNGPGDLNNTPAGLDVDAQGKPRLQDNGGPTPTIALLPGSAAIDKGDPAFNPNPPLPSDQRGFPRVANGRLDIGAFETQTPRSLTIAVQRALQAIPATNDPTGHALRDVLNRLTLSLQPTFWVDDTHLSMEGHAVFDADHFAVDQLAQIVKGRGPRAADAQDWIDYLVNADEVLAKLAIHDAATGDPHKLAEANKEFTMAEQALDQDKFPEAVDHFSHAWEQVRQAIR